MEKQVKQTQNPGRTSTLTPKGVLEAVGLNPDALTPKQGGTNMLSPVALLMMTIGIILDFLSIICGILILAFGIGLILSKIVYVIGFIIVTTWSIFRGGGIQRDKKGKGKGSVGGFLKKYKKNLSSKAIPGIGDFIPYWTITIYKELKS